MTRIDDVLDRLDALEPARPLPTIDEHGLLRRGDRWIPLTPTEERVLRALLERAGRLCTRSLLTDAGWPRGTTNDRILDTYVRRLRAKISGFGIGIRTVRKRGFVLDAEGAAM
jgi:DNA-binding response OmpR family regulator